MEKKPLSNAAEQTLPGIEPETYPPGLEKAITKLHAAESARKAVETEHKRNCQEAFSAVKRLMHEHNVLTVKLRIDGDWKRFRLDTQERGKFEKIKPDKNQKPEVKRKKT